jgi:DNA polymerase V
MYALVDAVAFYASAEQVFDPSIRNKPVVVLTNNDGCICAVSPEARLLQVPKFQPYFKVEKYLKQHNVVVRSSNYELYADLSCKMMAVIGAFCDNQHIYSIDESFLHFDHYQKLIPSWYQYGHQIKNRVWQCTKIPVGVGFGPSLTLAKAANHAAKKLTGYDGVAVIENDTNRYHILNQMLIADVWGIGRQLSKRLAILGINTAWDLSKQSPSQMAKLHNKTLAETVRELNGEPCLSWDAIRSPKRQVFSTRSFGQKVTQLHELKTALSTHAQRVAKNARAQHSLVKRLYVFAMTSRFTESAQKHSLQYVFPVATADSRILADVVAQIAQAIYQPNVQYAKCGVGAIELVSDKNRQQELFTPNTDNVALMSCLDSINKRYGNETIKLASSAGEKPWHMRRAFLSPRASTQWSDIPKIRC